MSNNFLDLKVRQDANDSFAVPDNLIINSYFSEKIIDRGSDGVWVKLLSSIKNELNIE